MELRYPSLHGLLKADPILFAGARRFTAVELKRIHCQSYGKWSIIVDGVYKQQHWGRVYWPTLTEAERRCDCRSERVTIVYEDIVGRAFVTDVKY